MYVCMYVCMFACVYNFHMKLKYPCCCFAEAPALIPFECFSNVDVEVELMHGTKLGNQKAHVSFPKKKSLEKKEGKFKEMTKTRSNEDVFET